jgi:hypothetical protein
MSAFDQGVIPILFITEAGDQFRERPCGKIEGKCNTGAL